MSDHLEIRLLRMHARLLSDRHRTESYRRAIGRVIRPGDVVVDIGAGTGIMSFFACQAGARRVFAIEQGAMSKVVRALVEKNGLADRIEVIDGSSLHAQLPERADVLVTETLWNLGIGEHMLAAVADARARLLEPGARIIPRKVTVVIAPVSAPEAYRSVDAWFDFDYGVDFSVAYECAANNLQTVVFETDALLAPETELLTVDLETNDRIDVHAEATIRIERSALCHGIGGWFRAELCAGEILSNGPPNPAPSWTQVLLPFEQPTQVFAGDRMRIAFSSIGDEQLWRWRVRIERPENDAWNSVADFDHSTLRGFPR
jgi:hypothetical protein